MKIYEHHHDGQLISFEVSNLFIGRRGAWRIANTIPGVTMLTRIPRFVLGWFGDDEFCRFNIGDVEFGIEEPFGDNSRYLIRAKPPRFVPELATVIETFRRANPWKLMF